MNDKNQNNSTIPDLGFIMNQDSASVAPKKGDKKIFVIVGLLVFLAVIIVLSLTVSVKKKVATSSGTSAVSTKDSAANDFITALSSSQVDLQSEVLPMVGGEISQNTDMVVFALQHLQDSIDFSKCTQTSTATLSTVQQSVYTCQLKSGQTTKLTIATQAADNKIVSFEVQ